MHKLWIGLGRLLYWLSYLPLTLYFPLTKRARVLLICGDRILLVRPWMTDGRWQLPGGGVKRGEDPTAAARRELLEETGLTLSAEQLNKPQSYHYRRGLWHYDYVLFTVAMTEAPIPQGRWPEIIDCAWVPVTALNSANTSYDTLEALAAAR